MLRHDSYIMWTIFDEELSDFKKGMHMLPLKQYHFHNRFQLQEYSGILEKALFISLAGLSISFFFSSWGVSRFSIWSIYILLVWRYVIGYEPVRALPKHLLLVTALYLLSFIASSVISEDKTNVVTGLKDYRVLLLAGLLFSAPLNDKFRKYIIIAFFISAIFGGLIGSLQYFGLFPNAIPHGRPQGLSTNPIIYATQLAFPCGIGILILVLKEWAFLKSKKESVLVLLMVIFTCLGILFALSRGVWLALITSCLVPLFFYNKRKALMFLSISIAALMMIFTFSIPLKQRALSIVTSVDNPETDSGSTGVRLSLWKGSLLIFHESPFLGTGIGDFNNDINRLVQTKKIDPIFDHARGNAHSSYFHSLATQGLVGLLLLISLYASLILFAAQKIKSSRGPGGHIIFLITILLIVGGLTVPYLGGIGMGVVLAEYCFIFGLLGPYGSPKL